MAASRKRAAKKGKKTARKRSAKSTRKTTRPGSVTISRSKITFSLTPADVARAKACLENSGEIRIGFRELRVTKLPTVLDDGRQID